jgi:hypothetical protein
MRVRHLRRQYRSAWRQLSRLAVVIVCFELVLAAVLAHRADVRCSAAASETSPERPAGLPRAPLHGEKLASYPSADRAAST